MIAILRLLTGGGAALLVDIHCSPQIREKIGQGFIQLILGDLFRTGFVLDCDRKGKKS